VFISSEKEDDMSKALPLDMGLDLDASSRTLSKFPPNHRWFPLF